MEKFGTVGVYEFMNAYLRSDSYARAYEDFYLPVQVHGDMQALQSHVEPLVTRKESIAAAVGLFADTTNYKAAAQAAVLLHDTQSQLTQTALCTAALVLLKCGVKAAEVSDAVTEMTNGNVRIIWKGEFQDPDAITGVHVGGASGPSEPPSITLLADDSDSSSSVGSYIGPDDLETIDSLPPMGGVEPVSGGFWSKVWSGIKSIVGFIGGIFKSIARAIVPAVTTGAQIGGQLGGAIGGLGFYLYSANDTKHGEFGIKIGTSVGSLAGGATALAIAPSLGFLDYLSQVVYGFSPFGTDNSNGQTDQVMADPITGEGDLKVGPMPTIGRRWPIPPKR